MQQKVWFEADFYIFPNSFSLIRIDMKTFWSAILVLIQISMYIKFGGIIKKLFLKIRPTMYEMNFWNVNFCFLCEIASKFKFLKKQLSFLFVIIIVVIIIVIIFSSFNHSWFWTIRITNIVINFNGLKVWSCGCFSCRCRSPCRRCCSYCSCCCWSRFWSMKPFMCLSCWELCYKSCKNPVYIPV